MKALLRTPWVQAAAASLLSWYLGFALRTTRWTVEGEANFVPLGAGSPGIFAFWHEFLPMVPALLIFARRRPYYRPTPVHTLVSQHRDGRFIGTIVSRLGINPILGSSSRGGAAGMRSLLAVLRQGHLIGITPDGPRGPARQAASGVAQLAALSGVPVVPLAARTAWHIRLNTWDRMPIPLPFGRGILVCGACLTVPRDGWQASVPMIATAMTEVAERVECLCPA